MIMKQGVSGKARGKMDDGLSNSGIYNLHIREFAINDNLRGYTGIDQI